MHENILKHRYTIKAFENKGKRPVELSHPLNMKPHPLSYMELPFDPEYFLYRLEWVLQWLFPSLSQGE